MPFRWGRPGYRNSCRIGWVGICVGGRLAALYALHACSSDLQIGMGGFNSRRGEDCLSL